LAITARERSTRNRSSNIVPINESREALRGINSWTQTIGIYPESLKRELRQDLAHYGAQRLVSLGYAAHASQSLPQDGLEPVRRMIKWIVDDSCDPDSVQPLWASHEPALV
jgi:hypothetical protein